MRKQILGIVLVLSVLATSSLLAQSGKAGKLSGTVKDAQGQVIPGAGILARNAASGTELRSITGEDGNWTLNNVPPGSYSVTIMAPGFISATEKKSVDPDQSAIMNVSLEIGLSETVVVTASKIEEFPINAPATLSVIDERTIRDMPTQNFGDLLRAIPGMNVMQVSARDFNITPRAATTIPAASQLVMIDGRTINQDYFGYVAWDMNPTGLNDVKQIEVVRGPASAVWGANALNGVVNIRTKSPREMAGTTFTIGGGSFDRSDGVADSDTGALFYVNASHAQVINDLWSYKITGGYYTSDAFARPAGTIPNDFHTPYPPYKNYGTKQPKVDGRVDYDFPDGMQHLSMAGGWATTGGTFHTGLGPFRLEDGARITYGKVDYLRNALSIKSFVNLWEANAWSLLAVGPLGDPLNLYFNNKTWDIEFGNSHSVKSRHLLSYGGNYRHNWFDLTMAPGGKKRDEGGGYIQDEFMISEHFRWIVGTRVDGFDNLDYPVVSPRTAFLIKPLPSQTLRVSYSRAYRAPSMFHNYLETTIVNRLDLGLLNPALAGNYYYFPVNGRGNLDLKEQTLDSYEAGYSAILARGRVNLGATYYFTDSKRDMILTQTGSYTSANPPPNWPLPPVVLDLLIAQNAFGPGLGLPSVISYENLGTVHNQGIETSVDARINRYINAFGNYSWQDKPVPQDFDIAKINLPPTHRFNTGLGFDYKRYLGSVSLGYTSEAYWRDVLDITYAGWTPAFTVVNTTVGVRFAGGKCMLLLKVNNLANEMVQNHIFGDLLKRTIVGEMRLRF